jgi:hypothetical protein
MSTSLLVTSKLVDPITGTGACLIVKGEVSISGVRPKTNDLIEWVPFAFKTKCTLKKKVGYQTPQKGSGDLEKLPNASK